MKSSSTTFTSSIQGLISGLLGNEDFDIKNVDINKLVDELMPYMYDSTISETELVNKAIEISKKLKK